MIPGQRQRTTNDERFFTCMAVKLCAFPSYPCLHLYPCNLILSVNEDVITTLKRSPYSITERRVSELIPVLGSQPAGDVSHKPGGRLPLLSARPAVTSATLNRAATNFAAW